MTYAIDSISEYIPPKNIGYTFVKRTKMFIPYKEIGISILERTVTSLSFVYETVLKYLSNGLNDIEKMAKVLGLEMDIFKEIIAEMALADLIDVSEMSLVLTAKGRNALQELTKVTIKKSQLNELFVNMVTGNIEYNNDQRFYESPIRGFAYLDHTIELDMPFLRARFDILKQLYNRDSAEELLLLRKIKEKSLYRILDIEYQKIKYLSINCFVYLNEQDASLLIIFGGPKGSDSNYATIANVQIVKGVTSMNLLFETDRNFIAAHRKANMNEYDPTKSKVLMDLTHMLQNRARKEEIETLYYADRYLLDGEMHDIITSCHEYKPKELIIASSRIRPFLQDNSFVNTLIRISANTKVTIIYNDGEYGVDASRKYILTQVPPKNRRNISFVNIPADKKIPTTQIVCSPGFVLNSLYELIQDNMSRYLLKEIWDISFDALKVEKTVESLRSLIALKTI